VKSLGTRLALLLSVILFSAMSLVAWLGGRHQAEMLQQEKIEEAETLAATLVNSLHVLMENGEGTLARNWLDRMRDTQDLEGLEVLRRNGKIAFRDTRTIDRVNHYLGHTRFHRQALPPASATKKDQAAARQAALKNRRVALKAPGHLELFVPIHLKPVCIQCHGYDRNPVRGILLLKMSTRNAEARITNMRYMLWGMAAMVSLLLGVLLWTGINRLILHPLSRLGMAMRKAGTGDRRHRLPVKRRDELGVVAAEFNAMQERLQTQNALIHAIVKHAPNAIIVADKGGLIRSFNPAAKQLFGYTEAEAIGQNVHMLMPEPYKSAHDGYIRRYLETGVPHIINVAGRELEALKKDGSTLPIELIVTEISLEDNRHFLAIIQDITTRKQHEMALMHMTLHDTMTGLPNRLALAGRMDEAIAENIPFALFYLGLNRFRTVNEVLGHTAGDQALMETGKRLHSICKEKTMAARIGGDIFAIFWPGMQESGEMTGIAHKLMGCMEQPLQLNHYTVAVDASIGITAFPAHGKNAEEVLRRAEIAMDSAKHLQHDYAFYDEDMEHYQTEHLTLASELRHAIEANELLLFYQPKVDMQSRRTVGLEALVRWQHPRKGFMRPDIFMPMAEETGLIHAFTDWVINEGTRQASLWHKRGIDLVTALNLAARNLSEADLPDRIHAALHRYGLPPDHLMLEITETGMMADPKRAMDVMCRIHDMGIPLSIDDFGTGYSSLAYLKDLPVSELKIDISFIKTMNTDAGSLTIVQTVIQMAHYLGLEVVAEGVEDSEAWRRLEIMNCDRVQGYYTAKPMSADKLEHWLQESPWGPGTA